MSEKKSTFRMFMGDVVKRWIFLFIAVIGAGQAIAAIVGVNMVGSWIIGLAIFIISLFVAIYLAYRDMPTKLQVEIDKPTSIKIQHSQASVGDGVIIENLNNLTNENHSHDDYESIHREFYDGYSSDDIMSHICTNCGKPRKQKDKLL